MKKLSDISEVMVATGGEGYKYIVAIVRDGKGGEKLVVRSSSNLEFHEENLLKLQNEMDQHWFSAECIGGGKMYIDTVEKKISIWGKSHDFGEEPSRELTIQMVARAYPGFEINK